MTKHTLKIYNIIRKELRQITRLVKSPEARNLADTEDGRKLLELYETKRSALIAMQQGIEEAIDRLDPTERLLIRARYIEGRSWTAIAQELYYSRSATFEIHDRAIEKLGKM